jgi:hypothetical protein
MKVRAAKHLECMEEKCMQDFGRKTPGKGPVEDVDADSKVTLKQI